MKLVETSFQIKRIYVNKFSKEVINLIKFNIYIYIQYLSYAFNLLSSIYHQFIITTNQR